MTSNTPFPNGLTAHVLEDKPFPLGVTWREAAPGIYQFSLSPLRISDMCDLLGQHQAIAVFGVEGWYRDEWVDTQAALAKIADDHGISHRTVEGSALIVTVGAFRQLVGRLGLRNLSAFGYQPDQVEIEAIANATAVPYHWRGRTELLLPQLAGAKLFLYSHDDCYLHLESYDLPLLKALFSRALRIFAGTMLAEHIGFEGFIAEVPGTIVDNLWPNISALTLMTSETVVMGSKVLAPASKDEFTITWYRQPHPVAFIVDYDYESLEWGIQL